jgi:dephospho-CoA kinase
VGRFLRVGLTGGLASGKSTVLAVFEEQGARVLEADELARDALRPGSRAAAAAVEAFGPDILAADGSIDRARLAERAFADAAARRRLEAIVHPEVQRGLERWIRETEASTEEGGILVAAIPLLFEAGRPERFDVIVVTRCPLEVQVRRAVDRGMEEADARARIGAQLSDEERVKRADLEVDTSGSLEETRVRARAVFDLLRQRLARPG